MKIFLIGMPGSGKTTLGKQVAAHHALEFIDLDAQIEQAEGKSIPEIFAEKGEEYFRLLEARLLRDWCSKNVPFVMATGGGAPCFHKGIEVINGSGLSVFLDCPVDELIERVRHNKERPLLLASDIEELRKKLEKMRASRLACYRQAKITLRQPSLHELLRELNPKK